MLFKKRPRSKEEFEQLLKENNLKKLDTSGNNIKKNKKQKNNTPLGKRIANTIGKLSDKDFNKLNKN